MVPYRNCADMAAALGFCTGPSRRSTSAVIQTAPFLFKPSLCIAFIATLKNNKIKHLKMEIQSTSGGKKKSGIVALEIIYLSLLKR